MSSTSVETFAVRNKRKYHCMFESCSASFYSLREFKRHATQDHQKVPSANFFPQRKTNNRQQRKCSTLECVSDSSEHLSTDSPTVNVADTTACTAIIAQDPKLKEIERDIAQIIKNTRSRNVTKISSLEEQTGLNINDEIAIKALLNLSSLSCISNISAATTIKQEFETEENGDKPVIDSENSSKNSDINMGSTATLSNFSLTKNKNAMRDISSPLALSETTQQLSLASHAFLQMSPMKQKSFAYQSPKERKYPLQKPIVLSSMQTSQFYNQSKNRRSSRSKKRHVQNNNSECLDCDVSNRERKENADHLSGRICSKNRKRGKKRKISEMSSDELAHLCLKMQDRVQTLCTTLQTTQKQLTIVQQLYRKKRRLL